MSRLTLLPLLLTLLTFVASPSSAQGQTKELEGFVALDVNQDGRLSGTEMATVKAYDADGDGRITRDEFLAGQAKAHGGEADVALFAERDVNEDGWLSGSEVKGFEAHDGDGDGEVTKAEFLAGRAAARTNPLQPAAPAGEAAWHTVELPKHNLKFQMPAKPEHVVDEDGTENYRVLLEGGKFGLQARMMKHEADIEANAEKFFEIYQRGLEKNTKGELVDDDDAPLGEHPGKVLLFELPSGSFYVVRAILVGDQSYEFECFLPEWTDEKERLAVRFLESQEFLQAK